VLPEILDELAPQDPVAQRSRRDLQRVNRLMGSVRILTAGLRPAGARRPGAVPLRLLELGAGDGRLMLLVARSLAQKEQHSQAWAAAELWLLDRQALVSPETIEAYARVGWRARPLVCDVHDWAGVAGDGACYDVIMANLFLHHFESPALKVLLAAAATRCQRFLACEPRRSALAVLGSHLLGAIGANRVTRHDAVRSVHAGFRAQELSAHWPAEGWLLQERATGLFSHLFSAWRATDPPRHDAAAV